MRIISTNLKDIVARVELAMFLAVGIALSPQAAHAQQVSALSEAEAEAIAIDAYIYGYSLVTMEMTRRVSTNVASPHGTRAPMGQFVRLREYPTAKFRDVTAPNADTLYTVVWLDVSEEPWIISQPDMKGRYFLMPMLDGWATVFGVPGKRTTGTGPQKYAITGPGWEGEAARRRFGVQIAHRDCVVSRAHLLHRHA